jgi:hypothetical protein
MMKVSSFFAGLQANWGWSTTSPTSQLLLKFHFQALFGITPLSELPPPWTDQEKAKWVRNRTEAGEEAANQSLDGSGSDQTGNEADDPQLTNCGGPDHPDASEETLQIMRQMLKEKGMQRFWLDLQLPLSGEDNKFCLLVARDIFLRLVKCEEYDGLQSDEKETGVILRHLTDYTKESLVWK